MEVRHHHHARSRHDSKSEHHSEKSEHTHKNKHKKSEKKQTNHQPHRRSRKHGAVSVPIINNPQPQHIPSPKTQTPLAQRNITSIELSQNKPQKRESALISQKLNEVSRPTERQHSHPAFFCPISKKRMTDPVVASDGHSYERANLQALLAKSNPVSPYGWPLDRNIMYNNYLLKKLLEKKGEIKEEEFKCPISRKKMINPVIGPDGHTYESTNIMWLDDSTPVDNHVARELESLPIYTHRMPSSQMIANGNILSLLLNPPFRPTFQEGKE